MGNANPKRNGFAHLPNEPEEIGLIGPSQSGMTGLVRSLVAEAGSPGASLFASRCRLEPIVPGNEIDPVISSAAKRQRGELLSYLMSPSPDSAERAIRTFALVSGGQRGFGVGRSGLSRRARTFRIFDTSIYRQDRLPRRSEPGWITRAHDGAPHIVLCHPLFSPVDDYWYKAEFDRLHERLEAESEQAPEARLRTLVIAFTRYELSFMGSPQQAASHAKTPQVARDRLQHAVNACPALKEGLRSLAGFGDLRVVGIPVSTYGFVRGDGRPNCDFLHANPDQLGGAAAAQFLTRPDIYCQALSAMRNPMARLRQPPEDVQIDWLLRHWRPFLTADAFITCISGYNHELIFSSTELLEETRAHRFT